MNIFDKVTSAKKAKTKDSQTIAYAYAAILVVFAVMQLFTFSKFLLILEGFNFPGGIPIAHLLAGLITACEVLALPFLLSLKLSHIMRVTSMVLGWLVPFMWFMLVFWMIVSNNVSSNSSIGFFGSVIKLIPGWWAVFVSLALGVLAAWSSWGLWPLKSH